MVSSGNGAQCGSVGRMEQLRELANRSVVVMKLVYKACVQ